MLEEILLALVLAVAAAPVTKLVLRLARWSERYLFALSFLLSVGLNVFLILLPGLREGVFWYAAFFLLLIQLISVVGVAVGILLTMIATHVWRKLASR